MMKDSVSVGSSESGYVSPKLFLEEEEPPKRIVQRGRKSTKKVGSQIWISNPDGKGVELAELGPVCYSHNDCKNFGSEAREFLRSCIELMTYDEFKKFVKASVATTVVISGEQRKSNYVRRNSNQYQLNWQGKPYYVCRKFYVSTIGITEWTVRNWLNQNKSYNKGKGRKPGRKSKIVSKVL